MLRTGDMARAGGGRLMKICDISNDAECAWFDSRGTVHVRAYDVEILTPFWLATGPRTLWPEINDIPDQPPSSAASTGSRRRKAVRSGRATS
jgi:uncharacterized protein YodC (DUF2158 family)